MTEANRTLGRRRPLSSATIMGITTTLLGAVMLTFAGRSVMGNWLAIVVLVMGLIATLVSAYTQPEASADGLQPKAPGAVTRPGGRATALKQCDDGEPHCLRAVAPSAVAPPVAVPAICAVENDDRTGTLGKLTGRFTRWCERHDRNENIWPAFDRWMRDTLNELIAARRVRCFRVKDGGKQLVSITNELDELFCWGGSAPPSLIDHVITTGHSYLRGAAPQAELMNRLIAEWSINAGTATGTGSSFRPPDWLVPIRNPSGTIGLLTVGELDDPILHEPLLLESLAHALELCWHHVQQADALAIAERTDRASGVLNRIDLAWQAEKVLRESAVDGEPVVVLALSVEGVRRLDDEGRWELRDWLMQQVGLEMRRKLRSDDLIGRFSDDRFVGVLRRLDLSLGQMIARKLLDAVEARINTEPVVQAAVKVRCGLADLSKGEDIEAVLARSFEALQQARASQQDIVLVSSRETKSAAAEAGSKA